MSGLGDFDQKKFVATRRKKSHFVAGRKTGLLAAALEYLELMPMPEKKKIAIMGNGHVGRVMADVCRERGIDAVIIEPTVAKSLNIERHKAMAFAFDPEFSFLQPTLMQKMEGEFIEKHDADVSRRPRFDFLTERYDNAWVFPNGFQFSGMARELAGVPDNFRGINPDSFISDLYPEKKLPRKAKKAYIAKCGRAEYRKMYRG